MELNDEFPMFITFVDGDGLFIRISGQLQEFKQTQKIDRLINCIKDDLVNGAGVSDPSELKVGLCCLSRFHRDNNYYRTCINDLSDIHNGIVGVYFTDYGNKENVHYKDIHLITKINTFDLIDIPAQCTEFILGEVYNPSSTWHNGFLELLRSSLIRKTLMCRVLKNVGSKQLLKITYNDRSFSELIQQTEFLQLIDLAIQESMLLNAENVLSISPTQRMNYTEQIFPRDFLMQPHLNSIEPSLFSFTRAPQFDNFNNSGMYFTPTLMSRGPSSLEMQYFNSLAPNISLNMFQNRINQSYTTPFRASMAQVPENGSVLLPTTMKRANSNEDNNPVTFTSRNNLAIGSKHTVYVSAIEEGPSVFAVQLVYLENHLEDMMQEINSIKPEPLPSVPHLGSVCLGRYSGDDRLYRAVVMGISKEHCKLFYVDYGNCETVSSDDVFQLPKHFFRYKTYSVRFSLGGFANITITEDIKIAFLNIVTDQILDMTVITPEGPPLIQYCDLFDSNGNSVKDLIFAAMGGAPPLQLSPLPQKQQLTYNYATINESGKKYRVSVSFPDSEKLFYIQLHNLKNELDEVMAVLQKHCGQSIQFPAENLQEEVPCAALYTEDQMWYRAQIKKVDGDNITVQYVDYGNCEIVQYESLKPLTNELITQLEAQAVACCLYGFDNTPVNVNIANQFEMLTLEKPLSLTVKGRTPDLLMLVDLVDESIYPPVNIANRINELSNPRSKFNRMNGNTLDVEKQTQIAPVSNESPGFNSKSPPYGRDKQNMNTIEDYDKYSNSSKNNDYETKLNLAESSDKWSPPSQYSAQHNSPTSYQKEGRQQNRDRNGKKYNRDEDRSQGDQRFQNENGKTANSFNKKTQNKNQRSKRAGREFDRHSETRSDSSQSSNRDNWKSNSKDSSYNNKPARESNRYNKSPDDSSYKPKNTSSKNVKSNANIDEPDYAGINEQYKEIDVTNTTQNVIISWFINPKNFYCQLKSNENEFITLMKEMQIVYKKRENAHLQMFPGNSVIAKFTDGVLYRGTILEKKDNQYVVKFVDYGNSATVSFNEIWLMEKKFMKLHKMSVLCKLEDIIPNKHRAGGLKGIEAFFSSDNYECSFFGKDESNKQTVSLLLEGAPVADLLIESEYATRPLLASKEIAIHDDCELLTGQNLQVTIISVQDFSEIIIKICDMSQPLHCSLHNWGSESVKPLVPCSEFKHAVEGGLFIVYVDLVIENRLYITIYNLTGEKMKLIEPDEGAFSYVSPICPTPILKAENYVYVSHVESLTEIYVQKTDDVDNKMVETLNKLYEFYETEGNGNKLSPVVGEICAAKCNDDENWYRGRIEKVTENGILVRYLDYGNCETVAEDNIKELDRRFLLIYEMAFPISLDIYSTVSHEHMQTCLQSMILGKSFMVNLTYGEIGWISDLTNEHGSVTNTLFEQKLAVSKDNISGQSVVVVEDNLQPEVNDYSQKPSGDEIIPEQNMPSSEQNIIVLNHSTEEDLTEENLLIEEEIAAPQNLPIEKDSIAQNVSFEEEQKVSIQEPIVSEQKHQTEEILFTDNSFSTENSISEQRFPSEPTEKVITEEKIICEEVIATLSNKVIDTEESTLSACSESTNKILHEISSDNRIKINLTHVDSPEQFWIQFNNDLNEVTSMQSRLQEIAAGLDNLSSTNIGDICAAKYSADENWYRAIILDVDPDIITVRFIDYGNTDVITTDFDHIKELDEDLKNLKPFGRKCSLMVSPITDDWHDDDSLEFEKCCIGNLEMEILYELPNLLYVNLYLENEDIGDKLISRNKGVYKNYLDISADHDTSIRRNCYVSHINSLSDFYIQLESDRCDLEKIEELFNDAESFPPTENVTENLICIAKYLDDGLWYRACITKVLTDSFEVRFIDYGNTTSTTELREVPQRIKHLRILAQHCQLNKPENVEWNESSESKFTQISADGASTLQVEILNCNSPYTVNLYTESGKNIADDLICNVETDSANIKNSSVMSDRLSPIGEINAANAVVSHINSLNDFWMQQEVSNSELESMAESLETASSFSKMEEIAIGAKCVALFPDDGLYYRAKILTIQDENVEVLYFDYGNTAFTKDLRVLPDQLAEVPQLAKNYALQLPNDVDEWNDLCTKKFKDISAHGVTTFQVELVKNDSRCVVKLFLNGKNLEDELLKLLERDNDNSDTESNIKPNCTDDNDRVVAGNESDSLITDEAFNNQENDSFQLNTEKVETPNSTSVKTDNIFIEVSSPKQSIPKLDDSEKVVEPCELNHQVMGFTENQMIK